MAGSFYNMENVENKLVGEKQLDNANNPAHYSMMVVGIFIIMVGMLLRFFGEWALIDLVSNLIALVGIIVALKSVYNILK